MCNRPTSGINWWYEEGTGMHYGVVVMGQNLVLHGFGYKSLIVLGSIFSQNIDAKKHQKRS